MDGTTELLSISAFARRAGLAPSALRFYGDCHVLRPARVDGATGYLFYSPAQEARAVLLRSLREAGLPLAEVTVVLDGSEREGREALARHLERMRGRTRTAEAAVAGGSAFPLGCGRYEGSASRRRGVGECDTPGGAGRGVRSGTSRAGLRPRRDRRR